MKTVTVLVSTYNGQKYLSKQLDSLISQVGVDMKIIVRDDGSSDGTRQILRNYAQTYSNIQLLLKIIVEQKKVLTSCANIHYNRI